MSELKFEEALGELEQIVKNLESGKVNLDDAISSYEKAISLKKICEEKLKNAELVIQKLETGKDGAIIKSEFNDESTS